MCILKHIFYQCPETEESREAKQKHPNNNILDLPGKEVKLYRNIGDLDACVRLRAGEEHHMQLVGVFCAHPFTGNCRQPIGVVLEVVQGMCADCLSVPGALPRHAWLRLEKQLNRDVTERNPEQERKKMEKEASDLGLKMAEKEDKQDDGGDDEVDGPVLRGAPYTDVHPDIFQYFQQVVVLLKHSIARRIPEAKMGEDDLKQIYMEVRAEVFCRFYDAHWKDDARSGAAARRRECSCPPQTTPMCSNIGRALRMAETERILAHHSRMVDALEADHKNTDSRQLRDERNSTQERFLARRGGSYDIEQVALWDMYPSEQARYHNAIMTLNSEVKDKIRQVRKEQVWIETDASWSEFERQLRMRAIVAAPAVAWIALDNGLKDEVVAELVGIAITWFLYVGTGFDPISSRVNGNRLKDQPVVTKMDRHKKAEEEVWDDIRRMFSVLTQMYPADDPQRWQLFQRNFVDGGMACGRQDDEASAMFHRRNTMYANAIRKLPDAFAAARKRVVTVATAAELQRRNGGLAPQRPQAEQPQAGQSASDESLELIEFEDGAEQQGNAAEQQGNAVEQQGGQATGKQKEEPPDCYVCTNLYDDNFELRRAVKVCPHSDLHLMCFKCTLKIALEPLETPEKFTPNCPLCKKELHGEFFRFIYADLGTLAPPSAEDEEDAVRDRLLFPPSDAVRPGEPFIW
ncbi:hypothetical protein CGCSCA4_v008012 [Colletotrichum siamense]|uniref:RING-type domain-containing protein n=1 Tax=Colletotrichum siamense TaxID=690259 RepID=A0A9P5ET43_COLSI|nr:hypothetical protein CGCSCA4_v008012 [Colletotrichum siamense]KAF4859050.1 hypothetical protein CGCSCA2_v006516 [Colletotrichum siamense]